MVTTTVCQFSFFYGSQNGFDLLVDEGQVADVCGDDLSLGIDVDAVDSLPKQVALLMDFDAVKEPRIPMTDDLLLMYGFKTLIWRQPVQGLDFRSGLSH